jgi:hypothetical protein
MTGRSTSGILLLIAFLAVLSSGCDSSSSSDAGGASMEELAGAIDAQRAAEQQKQASVDAQRAAEEVRQAAAAEQQPAEPERRRAGREGVAPGGYANAIIGARRHILNQTESWAWQQAVSHFQATNGRLPKDHAEFMKQVVEPNGIELGFKEENQEFLYDPNDKTQGPYGTLYVVEQPAEPAPPM